MPGEMLLFKVLLLIEVLWSCAVISLFFVGHNDVVLLLVEVLLIILMLTWC